MRPGIYLGDKGNFFHIGNLIKRIDKNENAYEIFEDDKKFEKILDVETKKTILEYFIFNIKESLKNLVEDIIEHTVKYKNSNFEEDLNVSKLIFFFNFKDKCPVTLVIDINCPEKFVLQFENTYKCKHTNNKKDMVKEKLISFSNCFSWDKKFQ